MKHLCSTLPIYVLTLLPLCTVATAAEGTTKSFTYRQTPQGKLDLIVHLPTDWKPSDHRAAIVFFFGGGWQAGSVKQFAPQASYLASRGMVAARADYRVKSRHGVTPKECVEDARSAIGWVRAHADELGVDPNRIVAAGGSAGGHLAACTSLRSSREAGPDDKTVESRPNALVLFNPVLKFTGMPRLMKRIGDDEELGKLLSPTLYVNKATPPALLLYGTADPLIAQGQEYVERAKEVGARAEMFQAEGMTHAFFNRSPWRERTTYRMDEFLTSLGYLKGKPTIQRP